MYTRSRSVAFTEIDSDSVFARKILWCVLSQVFYFQNSDKIEFSRNCTSRMSVFDRSFLLFFLPSTSSASHLLQRSRSARRSVFINLFSEKQNRFIEIYFIDLILLHEFNHIYMLLEVKNYRRRRRIFVSVDKFFRHRSVEVN